MTTPDERPDERVVIAVVTKPHGIKGGLRVKVFNPETAVIAPGAHVTLAPKDGAARRVRVQSVQPGAETWMVYLAGVASREAAEALRGAEISVARSELPALEEGEYYHRDLVGCSVVDAAGAPVGTVLEVLSYPSVDALRVKTVDGRELEIPVVDGIVTRIDPRGRTIAVDPSALDEDAG